MKPLPSYKHLETDAEFRERASKLMSRDSERGYLPYFKDDELDVYVWDVVRVQRKIVEVCS